jgi:hypothetical protein
MSGEGRSDVRTCLTCLVLLVGGAGLFGTISLLARRVSERRADSSGGGPVAEAPEEEEPAAPGAEFTLLGRFEGPGRVAYCFRVGRPSREEIRAFCTERAPEWTAGCAAVVYFFDADTGSAVAELPASLEVPEAARRHLLAEYSAGAGAVEAGLRFHGEVPEAPGGG